MNTAGHIFDSTDTLVGAYSDQPLDPTGRARKFLERHDALDLAEMVFGEVA